MFTPPAYSKVQISQQVPGLYFFQLFQAFYQTILCSNEAGQLFPKQALVFMCLQQKSFKTLLEKEK